MTGMNLSDRLAKVISIPDNTLSVSRAGLALGKSPMSYTIVAWRQRESAPYLTDDEHRLRKRAYSAHQVTSVQLSIK